MEYPVKKTFKQDFITREGDNIFTIEYEQATIAEYHEFIALTPDEQFWSVYMMIRPQFHLVWWEKALCLLFPYRGSVERRMDIEKVVTNIIINRFRTHTSLFSEEKSGKGGFLPSASLAIVCQEYNMSPSELYENHTLEQYTWFIDGIIYKGNEQTKEGKAKNKWATRDKEGAKKRAEETKKYFESI